MQADGLCSGQTQTLDQNLLAPSAGGQSSGQGQIPGYINPLSSPYGQSLSSQLQQNSAQQQLSSSSQNSNRSRYGNSQQLNMIPLPPEPLTDFQKFVASTTQQILPIYGASLFQSVPSTFAPLDQGPVPETYVLGPGDQIHVQVWGQVNFATTLPIDRTGGIYLPQVGEVHLAGVPAASLEAVLRQAVGHVFRNFQLTASVGQIRSIQVYVVGNARRPGVYTISSLSTLVDALFASGGPSPQGSMRRIEVRRNGKVISTFDLYDLLVHGDRSHDVPLLSGDVIFIPPVGPQAAILGSVNTPAIYEMRPGETIGQLIQDAGGTSAIAAHTSISVERIDDHQDRAAMSVNFNHAGLDTPVRDGDLVRVLPIVPLYKNTVTLRGNTANPGRFAWHPGMRLSDLIPDRESLITRNYWWRRAQLGIPTPDFEPLQNYPSLTQPNHPFDLQLEKQRQARLQQEYQQAQQGGGSSGYPSMSPSMQQEPYNSGSGSYLQTQQRLQQLNQNEEQTNNTASSVASQAEVRTENTMGATKPLKVALPAPDIDWSYAVIERLNPKTLKTTLIPFDLGKLVMDHDPSQNLALEPGDVVTIFSQGDIHVPQAQQTKFVRLEGEFVHAGVYSVKPDETLQELVRQAGGFTPDAYLYGSEFTRVSTRVLQQERINQYVQQLGLEIQRGTLAAASSAAAASGSLASTATAATQNEQNLIADLQKIKATGRIVLNLKPGSHGIDALPDIPLQDGDAFIVPSEPSTINVVGAVYDQNSFLYARGRRAGDYLHLAGGESRDADRRHVFIIRADGSVVSRQMTSGIFGNDFMSLPMHAGDTIVVPEKTFKPSALEGLLQYTQLFSNLALGAASLNVIR
ncbi:polysaccharide biosynthesis/export protein [Acidobacterium capsulatum ATCC 51196]|uniref:Polysaccharide biosynthesis/export protein n=2 Tax=Acidobacteriaceae TaxID=204434 RepID=C1F865_ACIC5|nr:polysaccharide biosynthesis/export protein [Acidobacterium capsulatum ATCC 51196]